MTHPMTQRDIDIHEIECAMIFAKRGAPVIWSAVRLAVDRLEENDNVARNAKKAPPPEGSGAK